MAGKLKLSLDQENGNSVSLEKLSGEALSSFLHAVGHLKNIIQTQSDESKIFYKIVEGSASIEAISPVGEIDRFYSNFNQTLEEGSPDSQVIKEYKFLKEFFTTESLHFHFHYSSNGHIKEDLKEKVISANFKSKRDRSPWRHELEVKSGLLYLIGGNSPNYHLNSGRDQKFTIQCSKDDAIDVNKDLYKNVKVLVESKIKKRKIVDSYTHRVLLKSEHVGILNTFFKKYNQQNDIIEKLDLVHDFVFEHSKSKETLIQLLRYLIIGFSSENFHQSELKTILVITKSFKDEEILSNHRAKLLEIYNKKRN